MKKKYFFCAFLLFAQTFLITAQPKITFNLHAPAAKNGAESKLYLAGSFNSWQAADTAFKLQQISEGTYRLTTRLKPGLYEFKVTRGSWETVECDATGNGLTNRQIYLKKDTTINITAAAWQDNFPKAEKQHTATAQVHIISEHFDMPQLSRQRRVWIYLPKDYETTKRKYPVLYMHDGQNLFDNYTSGYGEWGVDELMDKVPEKDQCIIIGIDHGGDYRISEYNPYDSKYGKGQGDAYVEFLVKTLKPYIDQHYKTLTDAGHTAIAGSSMGGLISMYAELKYREVFGQAGIFSPAFWIAPPIYDFAQKQKVNAKARFYFVCGDAESDDMVADMQKMAELMQAKGINKVSTPTVIIKGAQHNEKQWNGDFPAFYSWLVEGFK
ncbi:alpha/beta hydrolase [Mucilaginibacter jinjuensis]|uniref:Alpha/beta hydrolase-fold protein n=1 Tax=Mucilaginibacter jinjuensis TaxID=1176721 RepID=A0ABY7T570_9SPHI|nr:alpha/beta hydrolase-fold protein [Mucilaginibacter jinjuensis]WCT10928.1 alpha/beta hydrolase-fold protein [Mucilaginibacter jinjuensis]